MKNMDRVIFGSVLLIGLGLGLNAQACTTDGWASDSNVPANAVPGSPTVVSRYSEFCALEVSGASYVQSDAASDTRYIGRFYVLPKTVGAGEVDILIAYSDEAATSELFTISYDGTDFIFDAAGASGGFGMTAASSGWNLVEFEYDADSGNFNYWVNVAWDFKALPPSYAAPTGTFASGTGTVEAVQLGAPNGMGGFTGEITFDAYEAHRTTNVGALLAGDANDDGNVNSGDTVGIINENLGDILAQGQPDCNGDGNVNSGDTVCIIIKWLGS